MRQTVRFAALAGAAIVGCSGAAALAQDAAGADDPFIWLEQVSNPRVDSWIAEHNKRTTDVLEADPRYAAYYAEALALAQAKDRLPGGNFLHGSIYNFWQDADHVRGIWRKTSLASFATANPTWTTVLDLDALATADKGNYVWKGASCLPPTEKRCLISLSDGGEDAVTVREFDLDTGKFVPGGFELDRGKQDVTWENADTLLVSREWQPGQLTKSSYPYVVKRLRRGQSLAAATEVFRGTTDDVSASPIVVRDGDGNSLALVGRGRDFFHSENYLLGNGKPRRLMIPEKSSIEGMTKGRLLLSLQEDWQPTAGGRTFPAGSLVSLDLPAVRAAPNALKPTLVWAPGPREALNGAAVTRGALLVSLLDNVNGKMLRFTPTATGWASTTVALPTNSTLGVFDTSQSSENALLGVTSFLVPSSQWLLSGNTAREIRRLPAKFDATNLVAEQHEAVSSDGTRIPYFLVHRRDLKLDGNTPTLLYAYGGFASSSTPSYSAVTGKLWLEKGGAYALANIRGGGEFGPKWHDAGLNVHRQIVYDDFAAVGRDLIARKVTSPRRLGIEGGSNGGLLTGVEFTQHPELWNAAVIDVPLLDMLRIGKIAAGASWAGEYGDVADPAVRAFWQKTSPYHNLRSGTRYPVPFVFTTTKDDRVGPQHARKFAARMEAMGLPYYFYENQEGGHGAGANLRQVARTNALHMVYLTRQLMDDQGPPPPSLVATR